MFDPTTAPRLKARPLSPHLGIYRLTMTMAMSVMHRITGVALYYGTILMAWWLVAAASGPNAYATIESFMSSIFGRLILLGYTWALIHHALGGLRHLIWDLGYGLDDGERDMLATATLVGSIVLTIVLWVVGYLMMGGAR
ncbi:MAG: succinate dehydrogenase, cytochrome b556 subunit [Pseudolabrys sp.]|nr:succinate dehydrogenase, cytochrome b556 subunit [Pseudolabrys sp.]MBV9955741.1 succinate dehydrogenase, cytochrome b556 subunit [Pseudolabrys sp.]